MVIYDIENFYIVAALVRLQYKAGKMITVSSLFEHFLQKNIS